jgi:hypothetical protein
MFKPFPHERETVKSGNTSTWGLSLIIKVLLQSSPPFVSRPSLIKALKYLGDLRKEFGHKRDTKIENSKFEKKWNDACTALTLFGARSRDFKEIKKSEWCRLAVNRLNVFIFSKTKLLNVGPAIKICQKLRNQIRNMKSRILRLHVTSSPPCWKTITKYLSLASFVISFNMAAMSLSLDSLGNDCKPRFRNMK